VYVDLEDTIELSHVWSILMDMCVACL
jgi:hypothetical protein